MVDHVYRSFLLLFVGGFNALPALVVYSWAYFLTGQKLGTKCVTGMKPEAFSTLKLITKAIRG
jgi:hypothetical protein